MDPVDPKQTTRAWLLPALLVLAVLLAFSPAITAEFVTWDDRHNLFGNERMNPPTLRSIAWYWVHPYKHLYIPVTYTLWGGLAIVAQTATPDELGARLNPYIFHLVNILLHAASALAAYALLRSLRPRQAATDWPALAGAALFALHPVQVEPVAWVSGLKDLLAGLLSLLALWQYLLWARRAGGRRWLATLFFLLAMLSKPSAVIIPLIAAVLDHFLLARPWQTVARSLVPWLLLAIPVVVIGKLAQPAHNLDFIPPLWARPVIAMDALAFYAMKIVAPVQLAIDYGRSPQWLLDTPQKWVTWLVPAILITAAILLRRRTPAALAAVLVFIAALLPVLGLIPFDFQGYSTVSDHYLYIAMLAPALLVAELLRRMRKPIAWAITAVILLTMGARTFAQSLTWRNSETLFRHTIRVNPTSVAGNVNLGILLYDRAVALLQSAVQSNSPAEQLAASAAARSHLEEAANLYTRALEAQPNDADTHLNLGNALYMLNRFPEAAEHYRRVLRQVPGQEVARQRLEAIQKRLENQQGRP